MFKGAYGSRKQRHSNIVKWLVAVEKLGDLWVYAKLQKLVKINKERA